MTEKQADLMIRCLDSSSCRLVELTALLVGDGPGVSVKVEGFVETYTPGE